MTAKLTPDKALEKTIRYRAQVILNTLESAKKEVE